MSHSFSLSFSNLVPSKPQPQAKLALRRAQRDDALEAALGASDASADSDSGASASATSDADDESSEFWRRHGGEEDDEDDDDDDDDDEDDEDDDGRGVRGLRVGWGCGRPG